MPSLPISSGHDYEGHCWVPCGWQRLTPEWKAQDIAAAQTGVDAAKAKLADLKAGPKPEDIAAAQAAVDQSQQALNKLKAGATAEDLRGAWEAVSQAKANLDKVKKGGQGVWGQVPMPPNGQVPDADIKSLVKWVLSQK